MSVNIYGKYDGLIPKEQDSMYVDANRQDHVGGVLGSNIAKAGAAKTRGRPIISQQIHFCWAQMLVF